MTETSPNGMTLQVKENNVITKNWMRRNLLQIKNGWLPSTIIHGIAIME